MEVTIGGDRVGSGKKMKAHLHNYERSTHNLSEKFTSTMGSGILYPALCKLAMRGDSFDIDITADARTIPTVGPLFGSYKMQIDVYQCPIRLYQGILHNNPLAIGLKMGQVKFPIIEVNTAAKTDDQKTAGKFSDNCLLTYLGMRGLGRLALDSAAGSIGRKINALPVLSYYDIFKTYYANKQEENAYFITGDTIEIAELYMLGTEIKDGDQHWALYNKYQIAWLMDAEDEHTQPWTSINLSYQYDPSNADTQSVENGLKQLARFDLYDNASRQLASEITYDQFTEDLQFSSDIEVIAEDGVVDIEITKVKTNNLRWRGQILGGIRMRLAGSKIEDGGGLVIKPFELKDIDDMRYELLSHHTLGTAYKIYNLTDLLPYSYLAKVNINGETYNKYALNGLCLKTYQNDIFNNWLNTEWIEGENGVNELSKVAIVDGAFSMDALNFAAKLYNMLNRIALAGGTYEDWQDVVYEEVRRRQIESPVFCGGMSQEIVFDEIVQTAPADGKPLGELGGRGRVVEGSQKGGKIHVKCDEACFIIAIVSLTPRQMYTQGNEFYMTELESMDDLHKPAMDGIGFQDLIGERLAWWDTVITRNTQTVTHRSKVGKLPAWIEYMTSVDKAYGGFCDLDKEGFMILNRNYEYDDETGGIKDATTYVDPTKYNYSFAYTKLDAQNFWVQIHFGITARRKMSARLIPNV